MNEHRNYIDNNINSNRYEDDDYTLGRIAFGSFVYNPLIDSYIKNAYARNKGIAFYNAVNNGGFYNNYTFMGGNTIFGGEGSFLRKVPLINKLYEKTKFGEHSVLTNVNKRTGFNYINPSKNNARYVTDGYISNSNDILESGFGFGKKYNFSDRERFIFNNYIDGDIYKEYKAGKIAKNELIDYINGNIVNDIKNNTKIFDKYNLDKLQKQSTNITRYFEKNKNISSETVEKITKGIFTKDEIEMFNFNNKLDRNKFLNEFKKRSNIIESNNIFNPYEMLSKERSIKNAHNRIEKIISNSPKLTDEMANRIEELLGYSLEKEEIIKIFDNKGKFGLKQEISKQFVKSYPEMISKYSKSIIEKMDKITKVKGVKKAADLMIGNKVGMFVAGALGGPIGIAIQVALGVASAVSVVHQENSINNYIEDRMANYNDYDYIESNMGESSINSHYSINNSNYNDYIKISTNKNVSKNALREIDPIKVDSQLSDSKNFTIF